MCHRCSLDSALLWLCRRPAVNSSDLTPAQELLCAEGMALKYRNRKLRIIVYVDEISIFDGEYFDQTPIKYFFIVFLKTNPLGYYILQLVALKPNFLVLCS